MQVRIVPSDPGAPAGKLADAELHFKDGPLAGLKLVGFAVWEGRDGSPNVTLPARQYAVNGERRRFLLVRPASEAGSTDALRDLIVRAFQDNDADVTRQAG